MYSVIDIETTGGNSTSNKITEIAIVKTDGYIIIDRFATLVNPHRKIDKFVIELTGITDEMVKDAPDFSAIAEQIDEFTKDTIFVAHNVGFDYNIIKKEYRFLDKVFRRNNLCTVLLSRKILKNENSYSLGRLTESLGIPLTNRHRALGDAEATALLLHYLIEKVGEEKILEQTAHKTQQIKFTGNITSEIIEELPEDAGIFTFLDKENKIIYIGFAQNIFATVTKFLIQESKENKHHGLLENMFSIAFEVFNSFLITQLQYYALVKKHQPIYNKKKGDKYLPVGIFEREDDLLKGPFLLDKASSFPNIEPLWRFGNFTSAKRFLNKIKQQSIYLKPPVASEDITLFNSQYKKGIEFYLKQECYPHRNFYIVREVSYTQKAYVVQIENYIYKGFGEIDLTFSDGSLNALNECIRKQANHQQIQKIIRKYILKAKGIQLIPYTL